jgi:hypothetical protein
LHAHLAVETMAEIWGSISSREPENPGRFVRVSGAEP